MNKNIKLINIKEFFTIIIFTFIIFAPFIFNIIDFTHEDIIYSYFPIREWTFNNLIENGYLPLWNPYEGIGRANIKWSTFPLDILSFLLYFKVYNSYVYLMIVCTISNILIYLIIKQFIFSTSLSLLLFIIIYSLPSHTYLRYYYITNFNLIFLLLIVIIIIYLLKYNNEKLTLLNSSLLSFFISLFFIGSKLEIYLYINIFLFYFLLLHSLIFRNDNKNIFVSNLLKIVMFHYVIISPYLYFIYDAGLASIRSNEFNYELMIRQLLNSLNFSIGFPSYLLIFVILICRLNIFRNVKLFIVFLYIALLIYFCINYFNFLFVIVFLATLFVLKFVRKVNYFNLSVLQILLFISLLTYYSLEIPGPLNDGYIIYSMTLQYKLIIYYMLSYFIISINKSDSLMNKYIFLILCLFSSLFYFRTILSIVMHSVINLPWLPARDAMLFELCISCFLVIGVCKFINNWRIQGRSATLIN